MTKWVWGTIGCALMLSFACADTTSALRTPNGMLWANTTFTLQARAVYGNVVSASGIATVRVAQVVRWRTEIRSGFGMSVASGNALFTFSATNDGNGYDTLQLTPYQQELAESQSWQVRLYEDLSGSGQVSGSRLVANAGKLGFSSPLAPGQNALYLLEARPPSSSTHTDGVWMGVGYGFSIPNSSPRWIGEFVAGVSRVVWAHSLAWSYYDFSNLVSPVLYEGRLFWMGTNASGQTRIFYTTNSITEPDGNLNDNRTVYGRPLNGFTPSGFSIAVGDGWFLGRGSTLVRVSLSQVLANNTASDPFQTVNLPNGVQARLDLQPFVYNNRLYVVGNDNRLHVIRADGTWATQSARPSTTVGNISCSPLLVGTSIYVGTQTGWILRFDLLSGGIVQSRQVASNLPIRSLQMTADGRYLLTLIGNNRILGLIPQTLSTYWQVTTPTNVVSPLCYDAESNTLLLFLNDGHLVALNAHTGSTRPHYPQRLWAGEPFQQATLAVVRQAGRKASYLYLLAQQQAGTGTQARFMMVTLWNPYNRYEVPLQSGAQCLPKLLFTGNQSHSFCLVTTRRFSTNQGFISAILLR